MYQALYRKYRPRTFDDVVGQAGITRALRSQLQTGRISHAYLFTGSRGTGKTTCAKILAKAVNCLNPQEGNPCNCCKACKAIDDGVCLDVQEMDAATNTGIEHIRQLQEDAVYAPSMVKYRVYIIDEVHMLSTYSFNALLKTVEEPPEHLIFILATTEPNKVPATILSRCQRFSFRRITPEDVAARLQYVAAQEQVELEPAAGMVLGRLADGALRDGLSLLDQCVSATVGAITQERVYQCLGLAGTRCAAALMDCVARRDTAKALSLYDELYVAGKDVEAMLDELCCLARDLLVLKTAPQAGISMLSGVSTLPEAKELETRLSAGELIRIVKLLQDTMAGFTRGGKTRMDGELCVLRMCCPELNLEAEALNARLSRLEEMVTSGHLPEGTPAPRKQNQPVSPAAAVPGNAGPGNAVARGVPETAVPTAPPQKPVQEAPVGFWADLVNSLTLNPADRGFFTTSPDSPVKGVLKMPILELQCNSSFVYNLVNRPQVLDTFSRKASAIMGAPVRAVPVDLTGQSGGQAGENFRSLEAFGREHSDVVHIR